MLKDNLKLLLLGIAIVQMPLVGFAMKPVNQQPGVDQQTSSFSEKQLEDIKVIVAEMRKNAFNDEVKPLSEVDKLIKRYNQKILEVIGCNNLYLLRERFIYADTETTIKKELDFYQKAKLCKSNRWETLQYAIKEDDIRLLEYAYINNKLCKAFLIEISVENNKPKCLEFILKKCLLKENPLNQPLKKAALRGYTDVVNVLLAKGADVNAKNNQGFTPLMYAIQMRHTEIVKMLLNHYKIEVNVQTNQGCTALMCASQMGHTEIVEILLKHDKIDVNVQTNQGCTALMYAIKHGHIEIVKKLLNHDNIDVNVQNNQGGTALMFAIEHGHIEIVEILLKRGNIDVNAKTNQGLTALMCAIQMGHTEIGEILLKHDNIDVNIQTNQGSTALMYATKHGHIEIVKILLKHDNIDVNVKTNQGCTALMYATESGHIEIVKILLNHDNIDVNVQTNQGGTALMFAIDSGYIEIVKILLKHDKIDVNVQTNQGGTALMYAIKYGHVEIVKTLLNNNPNTFGVFSTAIHFHHLELVLELLNCNLTPWKDVSLKIDQPTARLFVCWYTRQANEEVTINGIIKNGEEKETILTNTELLERFDDYLKTNIAGIPDEFAILLKFHIKNGEEKEEILTKIQTGLDKHYEFIELMKLKALEILKDLEIKQSQKGGSSQKELSASGACSLEINQWEVESAMQGKSSTKTAQKKSKHGHKEIASTEKTEEKENIFSLNMAEGYQIVFRLVSTASKQIDRAKFNKGCEAITKSINALKAANIPFELQLNRDNHNQLRVNDTLPDFVREFFNSHSKPNVISSVHGRNKVYSDHFNQMISYLIHFMVLVLQQGDTQEGYLECWNQLKNFKNNGQLNIELLKDLYPVIPWDNM